MNDFDNSYNRFLRRLPPRIGDELRARSVYERGYLFPRGLRSRWDLDTVTQALWESFGPPDPNDGGLLTLSQRRSVISGALSLAPACLVRVSDYCAPGDSPFGSLSEMLSGECSTTESASRPTVLAMMFDEVATGERCIRAGSGRRWVPSDIVRISDNLRPCDQVKPDGSRGLTCEDEPMLREWYSYMRQKRAFERAYPDLNYPLLVKRAILHLSPAETRGKAFTPEEAASNEIFEKTARLHGRYGSVLRVDARKASGDSRKCDLLDRLTAEAIFKFLVNERAGNDARQAYLGRLRSHIEHMESR